MNIRVIVFSFLALLGTEPANAARRFASLSVISRAGNVNDITSSNSTAEPVEYGENYEVEVGIRMKSLFQFIIVGSRGADNLRSETGAGFRIDTPGFFWLGDSRNQMRQSARNWPVNTSIFGVISQGTVKNESGTTDTSYNSNMGLAIDLFPWSQIFFITAQASLRLSQGNSFSDFSGGIGVEF